ncbi:MAG: HAD family phosphatase [Lachnospiraceae bacterium]|nr:HAD family phosphatase [Lachnospiraceae bacterium]
MFEAVVFDMDGVIFDTEKLYRRFYMEEGTKRGVPSDIMTKACEAVAGGTKFDNKPRFEAIVGRGIEYLEFRDRVMENFEAHVVANGVEFKDGALETLEYLKEKGIKTALATSTQSERAKKYLNANDMNKYFDVFIYGDMVEHSKPDPDIYLKACKALDVKPENAIAVEDSLNGIVYAGRAGMYPVMVIDLIKPNETTKKYTKQVYDNIKNICDLI